MVTSDRFGGFLARIDPAVARALEELRRRITLYLPLTGGTLTGSLDVEGPVTAKNDVGGTAFHAFPADGATHEGGEMRLYGAASYDDISVDNYDGSFRVWQGSDVPILANDTQLLSFGEEVSTFETGTWTTTFSGGFAIGSGGTQTLNRYLWQGGPSTGDYGLLTLNAEWTYGTSATYWTTGHRYSIQSGFEWVNVGLPLMGSVEFTETGGPVGYPGTSFAATSTLGSIAYYNSTGATTAVRYSTPSSTLPTTWSSTDKIRIAVSGIAIRV